MSVGAFVLEVDWNDDGDYGDTGEDLTADTLEVSCVRGRDYGSQLTGRTSMGQLRAILRNEDGLYSSFNASSAIYGSILPGRKVRLRSTSPTAATLWTGYLDRVEPRAGRPPTAVLYASGPLVKMNRKKVSPAAQSNANTGTIVSALLTAAGWAGSSTIEDGDVEVGRWFVEDKDLIRAIQEIEDTEIGFFYEGADGSLNFESRYHRYITTASTTSQATFSDNNATRPYYELVQEDPLREIFNECTATIQPYSTQSLAVLWTLTEIPILPPGGSITYIAQYPNAASGGALGAYVDAWTTPVVGTDITQSGVSNSDIDVDVVKTATKMFITITNDHATAPASLTLVQARGTAVTKGDPYQVSVENTTSQGKYGERTFPLPSLWYPDSSRALAACQMVVDLHAEPHPILRMSIHGNKNATLFAEAVGRALSDRVTVVADQTWTMLGISQDFFIEAISHRIAPGIIFDTTFVLAPVVNDESYWQLDVHELGVDTKLGY